MAQINTRIVLRNDTKANWESVKDTVRLLPGEIGVETDTNLFKVGKSKVVDGETVNCTWGELEYANDFSKVENAVHVVNAFNELPTEGNNVGDIGIVKALLYDDTTEDNKDLYTYTSYVWSATADGFGWAAMDGNYNASNVYFDKDLTYTASVGALKLASGKNSDTYAAKGKSLETVIRRIMAETIAPTISQPTYSMSASYTADHGTEVGSKISALTWNGTFTDGSYSYGRSSTADGGTANISTSKGAGCSGTYSVSCDKAGSTTTPASVDGSWTLTTPFQITSTSEATVGTLTTECVISDAAYWPINNINEVVDGKIEGKTVTKTGTVKVTGYRGWFCGWKNGTNALADPTAITSDQVRALTRKNGSWESSMNVSQMKQMFFLAPAGKGYKPAIKDSKTDAPQTVEGPVTVYVKGANGYMAAGNETTNGGMAYDMWYVNNAAAASGSATLNITKA